MKHNKILAVAIVAVFCIGAIPLLVGESEDVSADSALDIKAGDAWGQAVELKYKDLEPKITEILKENGLIEGDDMLGELAELLKEVLIEQDINDVGFFDPATVSKVELRLDFDIYEAVLIEAVKASKTDGYSVDIFAGISANLKVGATIKANFMKAGTYEVESLDNGNLPVYEEREVYVDLSAFLKLTVSGNLEFTGAGGLKAANLQIEAIVDLNLKTNFNIELTMTESAEPESFKVAYRDTTYGASVELKASVKATASGSGLMIIPTLLKDGLSVDTLSKLTITDLELSGKISMTKDLQTFIDVIGGIPIGDEIYKSEDILNLTVQGIQIFDNGVLNKDIAATLKLMANAALPGADYTTEVSGNDNVGYDIENDFIGSVEGFLWNSIIGVDIDILATADFSDEVMDIIKELGFADSFHFKQLNADEKSEIKNVINDVKNAKPYGNGGDNTLLFVGIGIAAVAAIGVAAFFLLRKS